MSRIIRSKFQGRAIILLAFILAGCSSTADLPRYSDGSPVGGGELIRPARGAQDRQQDFPWELLWQPGHSIAGVELKNLLLLDGDTALRRGDRRGALSSYLRARQSGISSAELESAVVRIVAMQLSLGQSDVALKTISDYFASQGKGVTDVSPEFSLLFGYAYSERNDTDQALAWLSRAHSTSQPRGRFAFAAEQQAAALLSKVSQPQFQQLTNTWSGDSFVRTSLTQERMRRARGGSSIDSGATGMVATAQPVQPGQLRIGVLLPQQGRFANLGRSTQNGIELAIAGQGTGNSVQLTVQNSGETVAEVATATETLIANSLPTMVLGPLVSEQSGAVRDLVQAAQLPLLSFSRRSDFVPGGNIFRLGVTTETQIDSLLSVVQDRLGIVKLALVSSNDIGLFETAEMFRRKVRERGLNLVYETTYQRGDSNAAVIVATELEKQDVEGVFFVDNSTIAANVYSGLSEDFRKRVQPLGIGNWDNRSQIMSSRNVLDGAVFVSPFYAESARSIIKEFITSYRSKYRSEPDFLAAQGFDAATLAIQAAKHGQERMLSLPDALRSIDAYDGLTGRVYVGADGELRRSFAVLQLRNGSLTELNSPEVVATPLPGDVSPITTSQQPAIISPPPPEPLTLEKLKE